ncbi:hypothetical protein QFC22_000302 [Naganishia vaughanmartiniae]|uniref:Uncharacterized protein n=1 Tax=Naganishia vaughanmartiniae TaxID=1424756 RepID=A0ACC2XRL2_9TREE|nr:hypothetical protein QFC22_000302 [Naganishia vaughanmartiniae]
MASRLERIVALLETGSSPAVRQTAAKQLGDIAHRFFPTAEIKTEFVKQELKHLTPHHRYARSTYEDGWANSVALVCRILPFLASKSMETRLAAVDAINHIAEAVPLWYPETHSGDLGQAMSESKADLLAIRIQDVDVQALVKSNSKRQPDSVPFAPRGKVSVKKRRLNTEPLKDDFLGNLGIDSALVKNESLSDVDVDDEFDFLTEARSSSKLSTEAQAHAQDVNRKDFRSEKSPSRKRIKLESGDVDHKREIALPDGGQTVDVKPPPRRPGRPKGSKNKVPSASLPSSPSGSALLPDENDIFCGLSGRQVLMLKRKLKSNVITQDQAKDEATRMRSGGDATSSPVSVGGPTSVVDKRTPKGDTVPPEIGNDANSASQSATSQSPKAEPVAITNAPLIISPKLNDQLTMDYSRSIWTSVMQYLVTQLRLGEWEARHGSSLALRDLVRLHGESYGMQDDCTEAQNKRLHETALGSVAAVILEMLAQDRFGDFVGDQVVAPVREAGSQALASLMRHLDLRSIADIHSVLLHMILQEWISKRAAEGNRNVPAIRYIWELRHAGLLGLKYELAVRPDLISGEVLGMDGDESQAYMDGVLQSSLLGLADADDDVRAVAAACLLPIADIITERLAPEGLSQLLDVLWNTFLEDSDELNSSIASVMELLSKYGVQTAS